MARMIPDIIHPAVKSDAERKLFEVIRSAPNSDDWVCLHSLGLARHETKRRGEIDYLLLTRQGFFVLEVKGGRIARENGVWIFTNRWGEQSRKYESPFDQAAGAMFSVERDIRSAFPDDGRFGKVLFGFGVLFPDIVFEDCGTEADKAVLFDARDRTASFGTFIDRLAKFARERDPTLRYAPTLEQIAKVVKFIRGDFDLIPPLGVRLDDATSRMVRLTDDQYAAMDSVLARPAKSRPGIIVEGGAGTGKTLLAVEYAVRAARPANRGLFVCFNRLLASYLKRVLIERGVADFVEVRSIYGFLNSLVQRSTLANEFAQRREGVSHDELYHQLLPEYAALGALELGNESYDWLVMDEAQDFLHSPILAVLGAVLKGGWRDGCWRAFCDTNNQAAVYGKFDEDAFDELQQTARSVILTRNCRNTAPIAQETAVMVSPRMSSTSEIDGVPVNYLWFGRPADQAKRLRQLLYKLYEDGVAAGRITVLSARSLDKSCLSGWQEPQIEAISEANVYDVQTRRYSSTTFSTVSAFKGLENDYIILTDVENLDSDWWRSVIYVGMSRARGGLTVLLPEALKPMYQNCVERALLKSTL